MPNYLSFLLPAFKALQIERLKIFHNSSASLEFYSFTTTTARVKEPELNEKKNLEKKQSYFAGLLST